MNGAGSGLPPTDVAVPIGMRLIDSTPPATTTSYCPAISPAAAKCTDCCEDPHCRSTVTPVTVSGQPAVSAAVRAMSKVCSPTCETQPQMTSSTRPGSTPARSTSALSTCADRFVGCTPDNPPLRLPTGVRTASTITASRMSTPSVDGPGSAGCHADRPVEADDLAVEHRIGDDVCDQRGELRRTAEPGRVRHL